ncbi:MAG: TonB-dependent receptor [Cytophagia bacterium]|nr:MAG: TonB-dependent receptor [Runella sp.]TAG22513.1 MAG: TonB-dependent receptor [Cytophagales bacterium]TAG41548.1 MAG: TonB-dependent receptor [Cytophagia bacterium]TAG52836.1 MAG: TonB-dependent receptor [Runella slithyformis]TAG83365.1 MAG: TonB-dependent receptor [Cytophagales bacterium]
MNLSVRQAIFTAMILLLSLSSFAQILTQTIRGRVADGDNNQPMTGATVKLTNTELGAVVGSDGSFQIERVPIGRYTLQISNVGYETVSVPELLIEAGKEKIVNIVLKQTIKTLDEAVVQTARPVAIGGSVQRITNEQTLRYAATFLDPARLATSFAGVAASNDQANNLSIRGNSPNGMQWRIEGVEVVNPNHLNNAGTFSDRPSQTGGGTTILSAQLMDRADFLTSAFPAEYGNALGGVMDVRLRRGNDQRQEFTVQAGLLGVDLAAEGPFSKKSKASYLVNYRYSFTGLLGALGVKFGGEDIRYQDLSFNFNFPTKRAGTFTVFGMGGLSSNNFTAQRDTAQWLVQKDGFDIDFKNRMGAMGVTHAVNVGKNTTWNTVLAASAFETTREGYILSRTTDRRFLVEADSLMKARYSLATSLTHKMGGWQLRGGLYLTRQIDDVSARSPFLAIGRAEGLIVQPYASVSGRIAPRLSLQAGLHYLSYTYNKTNSLEPRAALRFDANARQSFTVSYGLHSQLQLPQIYTSIKNSDMRQNLRANALLGFTRAHHVVLGYEYRWRRQSSLRVEAYYQSIFNAPVAKNPALVSYRVLPAFSALNLEEQFVDAELANTGTGRNYGLEATYQRFLQKNYYLLITGSLYNSTYLGQDGVRRSTRFDGRHTFSLTGGKEFARRKPNRSLGVNARMLWLGGFRDSPIDVEASDGANRTIYKVNDLYSVQLADYFRTDARFYWKKNKAGFTRTWSIDVQNLTNTQNEANSYFDILQNKVVKRYQLGIIPVISYRVEF